jgi:hypothetical protein
MANAQFMPRSWHGLWTYVKDHDPLHHLAEAAVQFLARSYSCSYKLTMGFQWHEDKSASNEAKHGISFLQAAQIFRGRILKRPDDRKDYGEQRFVALGSYDGEVLCVVFTMRDGDIRLISARKANRHEREEYDGP